MLSLISLVLVFHPFPWRRCEDRDPQFSDIKVVVADMLDFSFEENTFDVVIEKGTMDVLFLDSGDPWNQRVETVSNVKAILKGVHRVLKPDGIFIYISFGQPHFRRSLFEAPEFTWSMEWNTFGDGFHCFFYLKKGRSENDMILNEKPDVPLICLFQDESEDEDFLFRTNLDIMENENLFAWLFCRIVHVEKLSVYQHCNPLKSILSLQPASSSQVFASRKYHQQWSDTLAYLFREKSKGHCSHGISLMGQERFFAKITCFNADLLWVHYNLQEEICCKSFHRRARSSSG